MTQRSDLTADIVSWTGHNLDATKLASIIRIAEANIGRDARVKAMYTTNDSFIVNSATESIPAGLVEVKRFRLSGTNQTLEYRSPNAFYDSTEYGQSGVPCIYTIEGPNFVFAPSTAESNTALLGYLKRFTALTADTDTNDLLSDNYDIYLFACLAAAFSLGQDDEQASKYLTLYQGAVESLNTSDQFAARQGNALRRSGNGSY